MRAGTTGTSTINPWISSNPSSTAQAARQSESSAVPPQWLPMLLAFSAVPQRLPPPPPAPPSPPPTTPPPPSIFTTKAALQKAVQEFNANSADATATYGPIADWDVSAITDMGGLFKDMENFNADISNWDTSSVTTMYRMFYVRSARALPPQP